MTFNCLFLVIVLVNFCNGQYPNIVPGFNGGLDPALTGLPGQFPGLNGGLDPSLIGNPYLLPGLNGGLNPSLIGNPAQMPGRPPINTDYETDESDVMTYYGKRGRGSYDEHHHYPACDKFCKEGNSIDDCCKNVIGHYVDPKCYKSKAYCFRNYFR